MYMKRLIAFILCAAGQGAFAADIVYQWQEATLRTDGEAITGDKLYHLRYSVNDVEQPIIEIAGNQTEYRLIDVGVGTYSAQIAASEDGVRGAWSPIVTLTVLEKAAQAPERMTFTVTFDCDNCNLEVH